MAQNIKDEYFEWLLDYICSNQRIRRRKYRRLLYHLYDRDFTWDLEMDENRYDDGMLLRGRFLDEYYDINLHPVKSVRLYFNTKQCSVLEMMIALAIRCEENLMDDIDHEDRTGQWFWEMILSLKLNSMDDIHYDEVYVDSSINRFLDREYCPNGEGGLFTIRDCQYDLREVEIWYQMCWYLDSIMNV